MRGYRAIGAGSAAILCCGTALARAPVPRVEDQDVPHTLKAALAMAYLTNPVLRQERAALRATDEQVPQALGGWRPTITGSASMSYYSGLLRMAPVAGESGGYVRKYDSPGYSGGVSISQPIYTGGKTTANTHKARHAVMAERARLIEAEQQVFSDVVSAYVTVVEDEQILSIDINNEQVYAAQLRATSLRAHGGEITHTDVAQAQGALANARAVRQLAEGTLQADRATYRQVVGCDAPDDLSPPQPLVLPLQTEQDAMTQAVQNNPEVIGALFDEAAKKDAVGVAFAALMPTVSAEAAYMHGINQDEGRSLNNNKYALVNASMPLYQGGGEYAAVRMARQQAAEAGHTVDVRRRAAIQLAAASWQRMQANREAIDSNREAVAADATALHGMQRQVIVGTTTTLAVLQQQETLLQAQIALVRSAGNLVQSSYQVTAAVGRLTARDLSLDVPLYDERAYYHAVHDRLWGISDYATGQPGR
ncbi:TolC family outer membrane protein [Komagataeibacter intermedius]|uniref:Secretion protein n=2 Tax=Komagataeibacter intermedius TaxID=66229 RepID=A0A0N1N644_9PROT|nr:TolC family outer membrane protein [Komagataeibacter intermedius]KPH86990.1 secretion protein [Komagataeibacter intermedius AF2]MCF3636694.1 TolC family outer membrane protein [Komagataeibacter intermedius]GAN88421.1 secretion system type I outer membrane protein TolC [Komagataeibacter intermedius TF2]GBQ69487.1 secretion system type I outer membrane protein TolC [Komagataeibacter intermedius NRIC 0521]